MGLISAFLVKIISQNMEFVSPPLYLHHFQLHDNYVQFKLCVNAFLIWCDSLPEIEELQPG